MTSDKESTLDEEGLDPSYANISTENVEDRVQTQLPRTKKVQKEAQDYIKGAKQKMAEEGCKRPQTGGFNLNDSMFTLQHLKR